VYPPATVLLLLGHKINLRVYREMVTLFNPRRRSGSNPSPRISPDAHNWPGSAASKGFAHSAVVGMRDRHGSTSPMLVFRSRRAMILASRAYYSCIRPVNGKSRLLVITKFWLSCFRAFFSTDNTSRDCPYCEIPMTNPPCDDGCISIKDPLKHVGLLLDFLLKNKGHLPASLPPL
jgi:hypothetical protein